MSVINVIKNFSVVLSNHKKINIIKLIILMIVGGFMEMCSVGLILPFIDAAMNPEQFMEKNYVKLIADVLGINSSKGMLIFIAVILAMIYLIKNAYLIFEYNIQFRFVYGNMMDLQKRLLDNYIHRPYEYYLHINSGEIIRTIHSDTHEVFSMLLTTLSMFSEVVVSAMLIVAIFIISPSITLGVALLLIILLVMINSIIKPILNKAGAKRIYAGKEMYKWLIQAIQGIKEIKVMSKERFFQKQYEIYGYQFIKSERTEQILAVTPRYLIEAVSLSSVFAVIALMINNGLELMSIVPVISAVAMAAIRLLPSINRISNGLTNIAYREPILQNLIKSLNNEDNNELLLSTETLLSDTCFSNGKVPSLNTLLEVKNVSYQYPGSESWVLTNACITIKKGETIGIIGASGSGKTTTADIILGLLHPKNGEILADGVNIRSDVSAWRLHIGYIPQSIFILDDTIRKNVAFGEENENISDDYVWSALREASLEKFVRDLKDGLDTEVGERGTRLSGGQRQRIGIARALYYNPDLLIFDEATSALDNETEAAIMESIDNLIGSKTMVIIAHRLTTIEHCNHVYKVEEGQIKKVR